MQNISRRSIFVARVCALTVIAIGAGLGAQPNRVGRLSFGPHTVGFRAVCDTAGRATPDREQLLIWYPGRRAPSAVPLRFSEYVAPSRDLDCGAPAASEAQQRGAVRDFASRIANAAGGPGEPEPIGGRLFPNDSAAGIAARMALATTSAYLAAEPVSGRFPIVVFAFTGALEQSVLIESLASHGYIVVTFPHAGVPPGNLAREGVQSGPVRDLTMAREIGRAIDAAERFGNGDGSRVAVMANSGYLPAAIWLQAQTGRLSALIAQEGRVPGAAPAPGAPAGTVSPAKRPTDDSLPRDLAEKWRIPVLDWQPAGNEYTRGVLESFTQAERIRVDTRINHANTAGMRRLAYPGDTIASAGNDMLGAYVQQFLAYTLQRRADASAFFDRAPEANGVPAGLLKVVRTRPPSSLR